MKHVNSLSYGRVYICPTFTHFFCQTKTYSRSLCIKWYIQFINGSKYALFPFLMICVFHFHSKNICVHIHSFTCFLMLWSPKTHAMHIIEKRMWLILYLSFIMWSRKKNKWKLLQNISASSSCSVIWK